MRSVVVASSVVVAVVTGGRGLRRLRLLLLLVQLLDRLDLLLQLHPPVLEPDLDLALGQTQLVRHLYSPPTREVMVGVELLLQLEGLVARVRLAVAAAEAARTSEQVSAP